MYRLIWPHVSAGQLGNPGIYERLVRWQPGGVVTADHTLLWNAFKRDSPKTIITMVGCLDDSATPDFSNPGLDPIRTAQECVDASLACTEGIEWDLLQITNRISIDQDPVLGPEAMKRAAAFFAEAARWADNRGRRIVIGGFRTGVPEVDYWDAFTEGFEAAVEYGCPLLVHGTTWPGLDHTSTCLRHRLWWDRIPSHLRGRVRLIVGETGYDGALAGQTGHGWADAASPQEYLGFLDWLSTEFVQDAYVLGGAVFTIAPEMATWQSFDVTPILEDLATDAEPLCRPLPAPSSLVRWGPDVSEWQPKVLWAQVRDAGAEFALIRYSVRDKWDSRFQHHYKWANFRGLWTGAYHYLYPNPEPERQARAFADAIREYPPARLPPELGGHLAAALDVEETIERTQGTDRILNAEQVRRFTRTCEELIDERIGFYTSASKWSTIVGQDQSLDWGNRWLWVAHWKVDRPGSLPTPWHDRGYQVHQYTSKGRVPGINGNVDLNRLWTPEE